MLSSAPVNRPEDELLLCCARTSRTPRITARIRALLGESVDWEYLLQTAHAHGMAPLLYWHLEVACPEAVPEDAFDHLRDHFRANSLHNLFLTGELLRLLNVFRAHGVPAVPYKGPVLAASVYGNFALRQFVDLDIMVPQHDVSRAEEVLASLGYRPQHKLTRAQSAALLRHQREHVFARDDEEGIVELHWKIAERHLSVPFDTGGLWERLEWISLGGDIIPTFSPEDTLLILCMHGSKHLWGRLAWICDVAELLRVRRNIRWEGVIAQAGAIGSERMLFLGLFLSNDLLGADLPEKVAQRVRADSTVKAIARRITEQLFREDGRTALLEGSYFHPLHLKMKERLADKIRYCARAATTQTVEDWKLLPLPNFLFPFYYVLRPIRLTGKYGPRMLKRLL